MGALGSWVEGEEGAGQRGGCQAAAWRPEAQQQGCGRRGERRQGSGGRVGVVVTVSGQGGPSLCRRPRMLGEWNEARLSGGLGAGGLHVHLCAYVHVCTCVCICMSAQARVRVPVRCAYVCKCACIRVSRAGY